MSVSSFVRWSAQRKNNNFIVFTKENAFQIIHYNEKKDVFLFVFLQTSKQTNKQQPQ